MIRTVSEQKRDAFGGEDAQPSKGEQLIHRRHRLRRDKSFSNRYDHLDRRVQKLTPEARYYQGGTKMHSTIPRLVMYGIATEDGRRDITTGNVDGVWYLGDGASREWYDSDARVGFFENSYRKASPCHE